MVGLSFLIVAALVAAVASFLIADAQWLLFVSAALVSAAFYLSRRASSPTSVAQLRVRPAARPQLQVSIDDRIAMGTGRHRVEAGFDGSPDGSPDGEFDGGFDSRDGGRGEGGDRDSGGDRAVGGAESGASAESGLAPAGPDDEHH